LHAFTHSNPDLHDFEGELARYSQLHAFTHSNPDLHDFEGELARYSQVESDISSITPYHNIGCMVLRTQSLKYSLQAESAAWKSQYSKILHKKASQDLEKLLGYLSHSSDLLSKDVSNVEEVAVTVCPPP
ncbi:hypothetical protein T484DRAFT_1817126, partial [Baffinella frigidus]